MAIRDNLAAYWTLGEASGTRNDSHGANHLTDVNTVGSVAGKIGTAGQFVRASAERLTIADNAALSLGASGLTVTAWVYLDTKGAATNLVAGKYTATGTTSEYVLAHITSDRFIFAVYNTAGTEFRATADTFGAPALATWYFLVGTFTLGTLVATISVNNGAANSAAAGSGTPNDTTTLFALGSDAGGTRAFDGRIDEVGVWKRVLTSTEITQLYAAGVGLGYPFGEVAPRPGPRIVAVARAATR